MIYYIVHYNEDTEEMQLLRFTVGGGFGRGVVAYSEKCDLTKEEYKKFAFNSWKRDEYLKWHNEWKLRLSAHSGISISKIQ